jgi:GxxExxY protein
MNLEPRRPGEELGNRQLTGRIIGAAIRVHRELGPGFLETICEEAMAIELRHLYLNFDRQKPVPIFYRGEPVGEHRVDFLVEHSVVVELKAIMNFENIHFAFLRSHLKALGLDDALLINSAGPKLTVQRVGRENYSRASAEEISL